ncbi:MULTISPECIES: hypothetical protein [Fusobacterium]|uniref:hypothetical protein n=1 Tax=Fusobacterium TaxID=848 RepID=UPI001476C83E|nr:MULTISPECIES: hypothetical protein [Fusobacterium]NME36154.1 hypothetical protein [Fusobacterium sp. FSA-380-WT-3A]
MLEINNFRNISFLQFKNRNYTVLTGDDEILLKNICDSIYFYFSGKKIGKNDKNLDDLKLNIVNYFSRKKEPISSKECIYLDKENLDIEFELGSKSELYSKLNNFFKEKLPTEPLLITINNLIKDLEIEETTENLSKEITKYSNLDIIFSFNELTSSDLVKKINIIIKKENKEIIMNDLSTFEKIKLNLGILEKENIKDKIFIFLFPERSLSLKELMKLKKFLKNLSIDNQVIIATFSKYLFDFSNLDLINIYQENKLKNFLLEDEVINKFEENYPILETEENIKNKLKFVLELYLGEIFYKDTISNKFILDESRCFIENYEYIFLLLFYLKLSNIKYKKDILYDNSSPFSNYIEKLL